MKLEPFIFCIIFILFFNVCGTKKEGNVDYFPGIEIPVRNGNFNLEKVFDHPKYTKSLNYNLKMKYPADQVLEFYRSEFEKKGWKTGDFFTHDWMEVEPQIQQRAFAWIHPEFNLEAFLVLRYRTSDDKLSDLHVVCQIQPHIDNSKLQELFDKLNKSNSGDYSKFIKLINQIWDENGIIDSHKFNKIVKKDKKLGPYLVEYKMITDVILKKIEEIIKKANKKNV